MSIRPDYYRGPGDPYEPIKVIKAYGWLEGFCKGNSLKYTARAGKKESESELKDMMKARQYLDFWIQDLEEPSDTTAREVALEVAKSLQQEQDALARRELCNQPRLFSDEEWREDHKRYVDAELEQERANAEKWEQLTEDYEEAKAIAEKVLRKASTVYPDPKRDEAHRRARSLREQLREPRDMVKVKGI